MTTSVAAPNIVDRYDDDAMNDYLRPEPSRISCYSLQRAELSKHQQPRLRRWLQKKWGSFKHLKIPEIDCKDDATKMIPVKVIATWSSSSTSGSQTNVITSTSNIHMDDSFVDDDVNTPTTTGLGTSQTQSAGKKALTRTTPSKKVASLLVDRKSSPKIVLEESNNRPVVVEESTTSPRKVYEIVDLDTPQVHNNSRGVDILEIGSVRSLDSISTVTMDPVLQLHRAMNDTDDSSEGDTPRTSSSYRRMQRYQKVKKQPIYSIPHDKSVWTTTANQSQWNSANNTNPTTLTGNVVSYTTSADAMGTKKIRNENEISKIASHVVSTRPEANDGQGERIRISRRRLRSYQFEPNVSNVAFPCLVEI